MSKKELSKFSIRLETSDENQLAEIMSLHRLTTKNKAIQHIIKHYQAKLDELDKYRRWYHDYRNRYEHICYRINEAERYRAEVVQLAANNNDI